MTTPDSRLLYLSIMRLGAAKNGKLTPSDFSDLVRDSPKRFRFLNAEQFGTILPMTPLLSGDCEGSDR